MVVDLVVAVFKDRTDLVAENAVLRQQLSCLRHGGKRPSLRPVDRFFWAMMSRVWSRWREPLVIVQPATVIRWQRAGFRLFWRWKSRANRPGRPRISSEIRRLIAEMARANIGWGAPRIHGELIKLGFQVAESTVSLYMPERRVPPGATQNWSTFLQNHLPEILAIDFAVVPTLRFEVLYVFVVLSLERRTVLHFNVTRHPTAQWTAQQIIQACPFEPPGRFVIRDNDSIYGAHFQDRVVGIGLEQVRTAYRSPWQNGYVERWIGRLRRECLDHVIAVDEVQLRRVLRSYVEYFHDDRTHLGLDKDTPSGREAEGPKMGKIVALPRVGGLHHRYARKATRAA